VNELLLGPIIGGLSSTQANLWGRVNPSAHSSESPPILHAWLGKEPDLSDAQLAATSQPLKAKDSFAGVVPLRNLTPDTRYHYALTLSDDPPNTEQSPYPYFTTFPPEGEHRSFAFAFGSCFLPKAPNSGRIFRAIADRQRTDNLQFILLTGDQIYADAWQYNGLGKIATTLEDYRRVYVHTWSQPTLRELLTHLPAFMILDDHEVDDDWRWTSSDRLQACIPIWDRLVRWLKRRPPAERQISLQRVRDALQAYWEHQGMHAPHFELPPSLTSAEQYTLAPEDPGSLAYSFTFGAAAFFVLDTRTRRVNGPGVKTMLGASQWEALETWLLRVKDTYPLKFLVTSSALLFSMWVDLTRDRWSGFPEERDRLLHFLAAHGIQGVYLLAGDLHSAHAVEVHLYGPQGQDLPLWEFCSSPFQQKPNWLARCTYQRLRSGPVKYQRLHFVVDQNNFGIVRVNFPSGKPPQVRFEIHDENGEPLHSIVTQAHTT
jgi:alkaline phosphatase D